MIYLFKVVFLRSYVELPEGSKRNLVPFGNLTWQWKITTFNGNIWDAVIMNNLVMFIGPGGDRGLPMGCRVQLSKKWDDAMQRLEVCRAPQDSGDVTTGSSSGGYLEFYFTK